MTTIQPTSSTTSSMDFDLPVTTDPFATGANSGTLSHKIHLRIQQRNGKKCITTISGLPADIDLKRACKHMRKLFCCNGNITEDDDHGTVIQLQGDQRTNVKEWILVNQIITDKEAIVIHGG